MNYFLMVILFLRQGLPTSRADLELTMLISLLDLTEINLPLPPGC